MADVKRANPQAFAQLEKKLNALAGKQVKAGWFESSVYPNGTPVAYVAAIQEYGYEPKKIPPRPFMRPTITRERNNWAALSLSASKAILAGNETPESALDKIGQKIAGDIAQSIRNVTTPKLKEETVKARARKRKDKTITASLRKPLVDSALMIDTVTSVVENS